MPNTLYRYSGNLGLLIKDKDEIDPKDLHMWHESDDHALIAYYLNEVHVTHQAIKKAQHELINNNDILNELEENFSWLKEKYPEEFL